MKKENMLKMIKACCVLNRLSILIYLFNEKDDEFGAEYIKIYADKKLPIERETSGGNIEVAVNDLFTGDSEIVSKIAESEIPKVYTEGEHIIGVLDYVSQVILDNLLDTQGLEYPDSFDDDEQDYVYAFEKTGLYNWDKDPEIIYNELMDLSRYAKGDIHNEL